jgi:hypothetical protein
LVELSVEDVAEAFVGTDAGRQGPLASRVKTFGGVAFSQSENAEAGAVGLLWMETQAQEGNY